ncbi:MAG: hypothetical protein ILA52_00905, partial [Alphaproteobacteria bacterium]|nr:hypothetical protein [Alphaproteobacteria bacterium]
MTVGSFLGITSCNNGETKSDGGMMRNSTEWTINPEQLAFGKCDTILLTPEALSYARYSEDLKKYQAAMFNGSADDINKAAFKYAEETSNSENMSARLSEALKKQKIAIEKGDSLLRSVDYRDGKFSNPRYEVSPKEVKNMSDVKNVDGVTILRNGGKEVVTKLDP